MRIQTIPLEIIY